MSTSRLELDSASHGAATALVILLILLTGCATAPVTDTAPSSVPSPSPTVAALPAATPDATPTVSASSVITLTVWGPEEFSPQAARCGQVLERQLEEFTRSEPDIRVNYVLKSLTGAGGLVDFLLKAQALVPSRLPDLIVVDSPNVEAVEKAKLFQPLDRDLPSGVFADLLPPGPKLARPSGRTMVLPITLDLQHLAYNKVSISKPPSTWGEMLSSGGTYLLSADGTDSFFFQYLENRGRLSTGGQPGTLDATVISGVLTYWAQARTAKLLPDSVLTVKSPHDTWPMFATGQAAMAEVDANDFWAGMERARDIGYAPIPTQDGRAATLVTSWNYGIVTSDAVRHAAAAKLLNFLDDPTRLAEWASAAAMLPARRSAFVTAVTPTQYADFIRGLLDGAIVAPSLGDRAPYEAGVRTALQSVLRGQSTPAEAASKAAQPAVQ